MLLNGQPDLQIRVNGVWLSSLAAWGDLTYSFAMPGGCREASWVTEADYGSRVSVLVGGAFVEVMWGGYLIWSGTLAEPEWNGSEVSCTASGLFRLGEDYDNLNGASTDTSDNATTVVNAAIARGLPWTVDASVPNVSLGGVSGTTDPVNTVTALLDAHAEKLAQRWYVDAFGLLKFVAPPNSPSYHVRAGAADLGIARDTYASNIVLRFNNVTTGGYGLASYPTIGSTPTGYALKYGHKEWVKDVTDQAAMTQATANTLAQNVYTLTYQKPGWSNSIAPGHGELLTEAGLPVHPATVNAFNKSVRVHGVRDEVAFTDYVDFVIASTDFKLGEDVISISPIGLAARDPETVLTEQLEAIGATS